MPAALGCEVAIHLPSLIRLEGDVGHGFALAMAKRDFFAIGNERVGTVDSVLKMLLLVWLLPSFIHKAPVLYHIARAHSTDAVVKCGSYTYRIRY